MSLFSIFIFKLRIVYPSSQSLRVQLALASLLPLPASPAESQHFSPNDETRLRRSWIRLCLPLRLRIQITCQKRRRDECSTEDFWRVAAAPKHSQKASEWWKTNQNAPSAERESTQPRVKLSRRLHTRSRPPTRQRSFAPIDAPGVTPGTSRKMQDKSGRIRDSRIIGDDTSKRRASMKKQTTAFVMVAVFVFAGFTARSGVNAFAAVRADSREQL